MITKIFLANLVVLIIVARIDRHVFHDTLNQVPLVGKILEGWAFLSILSIPVWAAYSIITL